MVLNTITLTLPLPHDLLSLKLLFIVCVHQDEVCVIFRLFEYMLMRLENESGSNLVIAIYSMLLFSDCLSTC